MASATGLNDLLASRWRRLTGPARLAGVDLARGLAVFGMLAAHLLALPDLAWADPATWGGVVHGRSSILFATLAGVSLALMTGGPHPVEAAALSRSRRRIAARAALIWILGTLLSLLGVPVYVILQAYAFLFLLALPFLALRVRLLVVWAAGLALLTPALYAVLPDIDWGSADLADGIALAVGWNYPFLVWITFVVAGIAVGRLDLRRLRVQLLLVVVGGLLAVLGALVPGLARDTTDESIRDLLSAGAHSSGLGEVIGSGGVALVVLGVALLVCRTPLVWLLLPVRAVGSMPLSAYAGQIVAWALVAVASGVPVGDLSAFRATEPFVPFVAGTLILCTLWALVLGRGPLERLMDAVLRRVT